MPLLLLALTGFATGCRQTEGQDSFLSGLRGEIMQQTPLPLPLSGGPMTVIVDIFSGRPNPSWALSPEEQAELEKALVGLEALAPQSAPEGLGYRGFQINLSTQTGTAASQYLVYNGIVIHQEGQRQQSYLDPEGRIEQRLLELSREHLDFETYSMLSDQVN